MQVPDEYWKRFKDTDLKLRAREPAQEDLLKTRAALAMCENIDWNVGRVLAKLDELKLAENTIVVYFSDNGPNGWRWNGGMKGRKGSTDEGGVRSPLLVRWPGHIAAGKRIAPIAGAIDLLPTLSDLTGVPIPVKKPLDGRSLKPLLTGSATKWPDRTLFTHWAGRYSVRTQQYRLDNAGALFDMFTDPGQRTDIAKERPDVAARLTAAMAQLEGRVQRGTGKGRPAVHGRLFCQHAAAGPRRRAARRRQAQRSRAELLVLHELDQQGRPDHLGRRSWQTRALRGDRLLHLPASGRRLDDRVILWGSPAGVQD